MWSMQPLLYSVSIQWNLSIKDTLNKEHLSNEDTACSPNYIDLCTNLLNYRTASWCSLLRGSTVMYMTSIRIPTPLFPVGVSKFATAHARYQNERVVSRLATNTTHSQTVLLHHEYEGIPLTHDTTVREASALYAETAVNEVYYVYICRYWTAQVIHACDCINWYMCN